MYKKILPENLRIKIRNVQYRLFYFSFLLKNLFKRKKEQSKNFPYNKKSIFYLIPTTKITGGVAVVCEHLNRLKKYGYNTLIVSYDNKIDLSWFPNQKVKVVPFKKSKDLLKKYYIGVATGWITAYYLYQLDTPKKIYFVQSDERRFYPEKSYLKNLVNHTYKFNFRFITEAQWIKKMLKKEFNKDAEYIPNGINTSIFYPKRNHKNTNKINILVEGAADLPFKGVAEALNVVNQVKKELKNIKIWYLNTSGKPKSNWNYDVYLQNVPMKKMNTVYNSCDFLLKTSKVEGSPNPPKEMIACGGIPIVLKTKGVDEFLDKKNSIIINKITPKILKKILTNKKLIEKIKKHNLVFAKKYISEFNWNNSIKKLKKIYEKYSFDS